MFDMLSVPFIPPLSAINFLGLRIIGMASADIKTFKITGGAAADYSGLAKKKGGRRATAKKLQDGGDMQGPIIRIPDVITPQPTQVPSIINKIQPTIQSPVILRAPLSAPPQEAPIEGGTKQIKVELKKKTTAKNVHLQPKKIELASSQKKLQTKKNRKVSIGISSLHKRITRAKKVHTTVKAMPIDKLREHLIQKKLIKPTSKAPEAILRQIAADSQIVAGKSL